MIRIMTSALLAVSAATAQAQDVYRPYGNGAVVVVPPQTAPALPYGYGPGAYGGTAVVPYGNSQGVVVTPGGAVPYGRYNKDAAREAFRINNALGGARAADDAARQAREPLKPLNPVPGGLQ